MAGLKRKSKKDREADYRKLREELELKRLQREGALQGTGPSMNWDKEEKPPAPVPDMPMEELKEDLEESREEVPPEMPPEEPPAPAPHQPEFTPTPIPAPRFEPEEEMPAPTAPPAWEPEEVPPEMPPEEPPAPEPEPKDTYEEDLLDAEEREKISREVEEKLEESFRESDDWWKKWNDELEDLMKM